MGRTDRTDMTDKADGVSGTVILTGWVDGTPRSGQTVKKARGRVLTFAAANRSAKLWRVKLVEHFRAAVEAAGGLRRWGWLEG